ncbi:MAG: nicotinate phosphoribosyltransferase [Coprobacillus sp. 28_7]|nr:MAG: nicotinate phosphoribosyltransferase [Coprobacillus sp. 28_7]
MTDYNFTLMCDFYELTMANGYFQSDIKDQICYFDVFFRTIPDGGGFAIAAGLEQVLEYIKNIHFTDDEIAYLRSKKCFSEEFLEYLKTFRFTGDIYAVKEGTVIFPKEPIMIVRGNAIEAQFLETFVLSALNHNSLIATKANRIVRASNKHAISEFGARRAHGPLAATYGARAAYIGGCIGTSNVLTDYLFNVPVTGTMAHSWVQMFDTEYLAFKKYCEVYPDDVVLLVDTFDILRSGVPNAIKAFNEVLKPLGKRPKGIRIDSGDIAYYSRKAREMLDKAGYEDCKIVASNSLDEYIIRDLFFQDAKVDSFGVGERLITSKNSPVFDGVYKLAAVEKNNIIIPKIKISENVEKITNPHFKKVYRLISNDTNKAIADLITVYDEKAPEGPIEIFDPEVTWKRQMIDNYHVQELLVQVVKDGEVIYETPSMKDIQEYCKSQVKELWDEVKRFENPHNYYVDLSQKLWDIKDDLLKKGKGGK